MKKIGLAILTVIICAQLAQAQEYSKYKFGFKLNPDFSWMTPRDNHMESTGVSTRFGFGFIADIHFTENYAFGTGVNIERSGGVMKYYTGYNEDDVNYIIQKERDFRLQYIEVPITFKMRTNEIGYITYYGQFGVGLGLNIDARADDDNSFVSYYDELGSDGTIGWKNPDRDPFSEENKNISNDVELARAALIIGAGIEYNLSGTTSLVAGLTYNNGFTNVLKGEGVQTKTSGGPDITQSGPKKFDLSATNSFIAVNIGLLF